MYCRQCGHKVEDTAKFCPNCGAKIADAGQDKPLSADMQKNDAPEAAFQQTRLIISIITIAFTFLFFFSRVQQGSAIVWKGIQKSAAQLGLFSESAGGWLVS